MARPRGYLLNYEALDDWLVARRLTRIEFAGLAGVVPSTVSGMTRAGAQKGASLAVALRMAAVLNVQPGTIFPELIGRVSDRDVDVEHGRRVAVAAP